MSVAPLIQGFANPILGSQTIFRDMLDAMAHPRDVDQALVDAYLARRALDYLVGFRLSPVLWRKLPGARSAGRVQSVALRLVCEREREIDMFVSQEYWSLAAKLATPKGQEFEARLTGADGKKISKLDIGSALEAEAFKTALEAARFTVKTVESKPAKRHPYPPFTTSTLQQEASRKLGFAPARTMQLAQRLYEGVDIGGETVGLITYMRTDGVDIAPEAISSIRSMIGKEFGDDYVPKAPRRYSSKQKNAQEAHEAIRPTDIFRHPKQVRKLLDEDQAKLYDLIWTRTLACQMESAALERTSVDIVADAKGRVLDLRASGQVVLFDGFLKLYQESRDDEGDDEEDQAERDQRRPIDVADRLGEFVGDGRRNRRAGLQDRGRNLVRIADHEGHRHGLAQRAAQPQHHAADHANAGVGQDDELEYFPGGAAEPVGGFLEHGRDRIEHVARDRRHEGKHHDRQDEAGRQHADAVGRAFEQGRQQRHVLESVYQGRLHVLLQERREHEQTPDAVDDRRNARQQLDGDSDRPPQHLGAELGEEEGDHHADRHRDQEADHAALDRQMHRIEEEAGHRHFLVKSSLP